MLEAARVDFREQLPELDETFLSIWAAHYSAISSLARPASKILEIGTGYAILAAGLGRQNGTQVLGLEHPSRGYFFAPDYLEFLHKNNVVLVGADLLEGLPLKSKTLAQVYCCDVIEHLQPEVALQTFFEANRVLIAGGDLILSTPNLCRLSNICRLLTGNTVNPPLVPDSWGKTLGHVREFAPREIALYLSRSGFEPAAFRYEYNPFFTKEAFGDDNVWSKGKAKWINRLTRTGCRFLPRLGDEVYILARKVKNTHV